ncbi:HGL090Wp [Eremothecium sinecaudum]|uniref:arginyltransferase n=1 Tax=Eremothecium sinecaudum TaxID=45286 RepID=A0A0X8HVN6_9SACH|nr:HGL090Wp [Eremothecium sinecaudum]AMD22250.1 HGL090Wp [Eremothecium sinecaudum]
MDVSERLITLYMPMYITEGSDTSCGYCKGKKKDSSKYSVNSWQYHYQEQLPESQRDVNNISIGMQVEQLTVEMYDNMCNMGFRRSGKLIYKTDMLRNCCRLYTIRTNSSMFKISKELKTCVKKFVKNISDNGDSEVPSDAVNGFESSEYRFINDIVNAELNSKSFYTRFEPAIFTKEKYDLYVRYQRIVHNDVSGLKPKAFEQFLCSSPFPNSIVQGNSEEWQELNDWRMLKKDQTVNRLGPAHECYYHNGKLIAVAVLDFLPTGLSSIYFIWDPDYSKWSLGKISALREMALIEKIHRPYYYMGYYIDDCPKMQYKAKYGGELLDVCTNRYFPLDEVRPFINGSKLFVMHELKDEKPIRELLLSFNPGEREDVEGRNNVIEHIYGKNGAAIENANSTIYQLQSRGIAYPLQPPFDILSVGKIDHKNSFFDVLNRIGYSDNHYNFPAIVPGLLPLWQLMEMLQNGSIKKINNNLMLLNMVTGQLRAVRDFDKENPFIKQIICNVIRLIGLDNTAKALIII